MELSRGLHQLLVFLLAVTTAHLPVRVVGKLKGQCDEILYLFLLNSRGKLAKARKTKRELSETMQIEAKLRNTWSPGWEFDQQFFDRIDGVL